jgi:dihydroflavonol-4-reductase
VGRAPRYDNSKIQKELGIRFRPVKDSVLGTVDDMAKHGHIEKN